jgi:hypothetical protein
VAFPGTAYRSPSRLGFSEAKRALTFGCPDRGRQRRTRGGERARKGANLDRFPGRYLYFGPRDRGPRESVALPAAMHRWPRTAHTYQKTPFSRAAAPMFVVGRIREPTSGSITDSDIGWFVVRREQAGLWFARWEGSNRPRFIHRLWITLWISQRIRSGEGR